MVMPVFTVTAVLLVVFSLVVVLLVRSVPNKLLLLGVLMAVAAIAFAAVIPSVASLALVLVILAAILVLAGLLATLVAYLVHLFTPAKAHVPPPPQVAGAGKKPDSAADTK